ncbi:metallophosphoesterase [Sporosarcina oncorhynchi]|uniref:Metallophosphoesterase n=1 Tax=Sporosarcina oncorhynchi TaxID=3056444 RepID=A0ABZ0L1B3_9BACL|nr:metallophosphoesterase [Sporosarcina sp. T2O-4]WOV85994.1 metallophosphoesterase [Sporosarcina sp. T2O-4]
MKILFKCTLAVFLFIISLLMHMFFLAKRRNVCHHSYSVDSENPERKVLSVFFISDIHRRRIDKRLMKQVKTFGEMDVVVIGGDLAEGGVPLSRINRNVKELSKLGQLFFIWGNNDREIGEEALREIITRNGGTILDNENAVIKVHPSWAICGTDDPSNRNVDVQSTLKNINQYKHLIVATHTPSLFRKIEEIIHPELMLAGHMHGGQIRFGKYGMQPLGKFSEQEGKAKLISNGYGTSLLPLRLGAKPESHVIKINY